MRAVAAPRMARSLFSLCPLFLFLLRCFSGSNVTTIRRSRRRSSNRARTCTSTTRAAGVRESRQISPSNTGTSRTNWPCRSRPRSETTASPPPTQPFHDGVRAHASLLQREGLLAATHAVSMCSTLLFTPLRLATVLVCRDHAFGLFFCFCTVFFPTHHI